MPADPPPTDGRQARRVRNRNAVIDAMFALLEDGRFPPSVDEVAERADVSVSSVFRYFDGLDDLQEQTVRRYFERFAPLFEVPPASDNTSAGRIRTYVVARLDLYEAIAPIARMARVRAIEQPTIARSLQDTRQTFLEQARDHFADDLDRFTRADADDRIALIDALTSFESWDLLHTAHGRSRRRIERAWTTGIGAVLA